MSEAGTRNTRDAGGAAQALGAWLVWRGLCAAALAGALALPTSTRAREQGQAGPDLTEVRASVGIDFEHRYGSLEKRYITESGGSGGAWLDYDVDGRLDLLLVNALEGLLEDPVASSIAALAGASGAGVERASGHSLFRNRSGETTTFREASEQAGVGDAVFGNAAAVADVDNDGFPELLVTAIGPDRLYRNNGDGTYSPWRAGIEDAGWSASAVFADWDGDGWLDLYVTGYVDFDASATPVAGEGRCFYQGHDVFCGPEGLAGAPDRFYRNSRSRNNGSRGSSEGMSFEPWMVDDVDPEGLYGFAVVATDCDGDRRPEIYVANDSNINMLYRRVAGSSAGSESIEDWALFGGAGYSGDGREQAGMAASAADVDGDGRVDLFVTNFHNDHNTLYRNLGDCSFEDAADRLGLSASSFPYMGWGAQFVDLDGDGDEDLYVANGHIHPALDAAGLEPYAQRNLLYMNRLRESGEPGFDEIGASPGEAKIASSRAVLRGDFDNDGDADLLVTNIDAQPHLLRNDGPIASPALRLTLIGRDANRAAHGAWVTVESGGVTQHVELRSSEGYLGSNDPRLLVHLPGGQADRVSVRWPGGGETVLENQSPGWLILDQDRGVIARRSFNGEPQRRGGVHE